MQQPAAQPLTDIHCHLLPGLDDGSSSWAETLAMARMAVADGIRTVIATPHQLGHYSQNRGDCIRQATRRLADCLRDHEVPLRVLPGADVRIEPEMVPRIHRGEVLSLADRGKHVLLELPHELYFQLQPVLNQLQESGLHGILSHPERNQGLLARPHTIPRLVADGCLMQITAGSIVGTFGPASRQLSQWMLHRGLVHFVASDGHGAKMRRPLLRRAWVQVAKLVGRETCVDLFCRNPRAVAEGRDVAAGKRPARSRRIRQWFQWPAAG